MSTDAQPGPAPAFPPGEVPAGPAFVGKPTVPLLASEFIGYVEHIMELAKQALAHPVDGGFFAVIVPLSGWATCRQFPTVAALVDHVRGFHGQDVQVFVFAGSRFGTTHGGDYLATPWGSHPLFVTAQAGALDDSGFMGTDPQLVQPAQPALDPDADNQDADEDDDEDEDEGGS